MIFSCLSSVLLDVHESTYFLLLASTSLSLEMIINDDLIGGVLSFGAVFGGMVNLGISLLATNYFWDDVSNDDKVLWAVIGFVVSHHSS